MALFNKLFSTRKNTTSKQQDTSEKLFAFNKDQVRIILFRECDFRGRKLLFDSNTIEKIPIENETKVEHGKFSEIFDGYGYMYTKTQQDTNQLSEMVFGSVAMSFRGTYFKIHNLTNPTRLMFSQVFPSPPTSSKYRRVSASSPFNSRPNNSSSTTSFEHSNNRLDDSGASSMSISERLSVNSTNSDTILISKRCHSTPLDVRPFINNVYYRGDSGCYTSQNTQSCHSTLGQYLNASTLSLNYSNCYKKWLRRHSTSLDKAGNSLPTSFEDIISKTGHSRSKLGLALIIQPTLGQEEKLGKFLMEHVAVIESILWRARYLLEIAFIKTKQFLPFYNFTSQCLVNLLSGSYLSINMWLSLSTGCDSFDSINAFNNQQGQTSTNNKTADLLQSSSSSIEFRKRLFLYNKQNNNFLNIKNIFKSELDLTNNKNKPLFYENKSLKAEQFLYEFCELLETVDVKDTNFFISTLLTAVLTHHLGWVNTCLPSNNNIESNIPYNPLWGQLSDLYGAIGYPTKMSQTIINGKNDRNDLMKKIINILTYFIRCCNIERYLIERCNINEDNKCVENICLKQSCIPKENYKKYEDHLREILLTNNSLFNSNIKDEKFKLNNDFIIKKKKTLKKCKSKTNLNELTTLECIKNKTMGLNKSKTRLDLKNYVEEEDEEAGTTNGINSRVLRSNNLLTNLNNDKELLEETNNNKENVVFVLGENDILIGLKKNYLNFDDKDFIKYDENSTTIKPSTSWKENDYFINKKQNIRSQSVPPPDCSTKKNIKNDNGDDGNRNNEIKPKYRYSGVKFNLQQYPQILSNYMKSKNLEMSNLHFGDKYGDDAAKINDEGASNFNNNIITTNLINDYNYDEESEALQTPSNASELEFTSDLFIQSPPIVQKTKETTTSDNLKHKIKENNLSKTDNNNNNDNAKMKIAHLPMPKSISFKSSVKSIEYTSSLMRPVNDYYLPDMILQGTTVPKQHWESKLKKDLALATQRSLIDQPIDEAVAIIANVDNWEVQLMSSHTYIVDKGSSGIRVGMSQLVANMLESLLQLWKLNVPPEYCLLHLEQMLQELCLRSKALAQLLLATEFCSMELLTSTLHLEVNDVPLLLAVASTHTPQVTQKYGLSFQ